MKKYLILIITNKHYFVTIKNYQLYQFLLSSLKRNKLSQFKNNKKIKQSDVNKYSLIINCDSKNNLSKKFFFKKLKKKYDSYAYTTIIKHKKVSNNTAFQIFTKKGPLAFLPISETQDFNRLFNKR